MIVGYFQIIGDYLISIEGKVKVLNASLLKIGFDYRY